MAEVYVPPFKEIKTMRRDVTRRNGNTDRGPIDVFVVVDVVSWPIPD
jgi:hypothetical protein